MIKLFSKLFIMKKVGYHLNDNTFDNTFAVDY